jgi:folylpolyglutamate synthase/dihydropteroate synthase
MAPAPIAAEFSRHGRETEVIETIPEALSLALALAGDRDLICATGSLFVVGEVIKEANQLKLAT